MKTPRRGGTVALLCLHFYPEMISTGIHMTELAVALARRGWRVQAICAQPSLSSGDNPEVERELLHDGVRITRVPTVGRQNATLLSRALFAVSFALSTAMWLIRNRRTVSGLVITTNPPFLALLGWGARKLSGLPYVLIVYDVYPEIAARLGVIRSGSLLERVWAWASRVMLNGAERVVVIGRDMDAIVRPKMRPARQSRIRLIRNWSDEETVSPVIAANPFAQEHGLEGRFVVQYSGRMGRTHNLEPLIEAAAQMRGEPVVFQVIGDGAKRDALRSLAASLGADNVQFLPYQPMERLGEALSAADVSVVCLASEFTGVSVPSKTYGIMAAGRPILALCDRESEIGQTLVEHDCGIVLDEPSPEQIIAAIDGLRRDADRLAAMGQAARRAFESNFTLAVAASHYDLCLSEAFGDSVDARQPGDAMSRHAA